MSNILEKAMTSQVGEELMRQLRESYPNELPEHPITGAEAARLQGQQDVIKFLERLKEQQEQGVDLIEGLPPSTRIEIL